MRQVIPAWPAAGQWGSYNDPYLSSYIHIYMHTCMHAYSVSLFPSSSQFSKPRPNTKTLFSLSFPFLFFILPKSAFFLAAEVWILFQWDCQKMTLSKVQCQWVVIMWNVLHALIWVIINEWQIFIIPSLKPVSNTEYRSFEIVSITCHQDTQMRLAVIKVNFLFLPALAECQRFAGSER